MQLLQPTARDRTSKDISRPRLTSSKPRWMPGALAASAGLSLTIFAGAVLAGNSDGLAAPQTFIRNLEPFADPTGAVATFNANGRIDTQGAFFQSLGTNGRSCATCHVADQAFSVSVAKIRERFETTRGRDPLFAPVDGANCANAKTDDSKGHSLLLEHGLIRIALAVPANAQFTLSVVHDPYGCALVADAASGQMIASVYRRPLPTANLRFLSAVMHDGRETVEPLTSGTTYAASLQADLTHQALDAITGHAQADKIPTSKQLADIVDFELGLYTAQIWDRSAGFLHASGAKGGPLRLAYQDYLPGVNDVLGADPNGVPFSSGSMTVFAAWANVGFQSAEEESEDRPPEFGGRDSRSPFDRAAARRDIAAGEALFNTMPLTISAVRGLNDNATLGKPASFKGTCTSCHDAPNVGDHSLPLPLDIGVGHSPLPGFENDPNVGNGMAELDEPNLPVFLVSGCSSPFSAGQPVSFYTTDPGKALISGLCADMNRVKGPILRGLAARAPYFHNGSAATLLQAVNFYNQRFSMNLTEEQKRQLVAFLDSL
jgi:cytochrome c peroxidase